jgi:DNA invertase Pin-like site-specific DNA recombinase
VYINDYEVRHDFKKDFREDMPLEKMARKYRVEDIKKTCLDNVNEYDLKKRKTKRIVDLRKLGLYFTEIAKETGLDVSTVQRYYNSRNG